MTAWAKLVEGAFISGSSLLPHTLSNKCWEVSEGEAGYATCCIRSLCLQNQLLTWIARSCYPEQSGQWCPYAGSPNDPAPFSSWPSQWSPPLPYPLWPAGKYSPEGWEKNKAVSRSWTRCADTVMHPWVVSEETPLLTWSFYVQMCLFRIKPSTCFCMSGGPRNIRLVNMELVVYVR